MLQRVLYTSRLDHSERSKSALKLRAPTPRSLLIFTIARDALPLTHEPNVNSNTRDPVTRVSIREPDVCIGDAWNRYRRRYICSVDWTDTRLATRVMPRSRCWWWRTLSHTIRYHTTAYYTILYNIISNYTIIHHTMPH